MTLEVDNHLTHLARVFAVVHRLHVQSAAPMSSKNPTYFALGQTLTLRTVMSSHLLVRFSSFYPAKWM